MRLALLIAFCILALDQVTKVVIVHVLDLRNRGEIDVLPPFVNFRMAWNEGINFGLFAQQGDLMKWVLVAIAVFISLGVLWWIHHEKPRKMGFVAAGLLIGGALGNAIDRVLYGAVADFLNMSCCGFDNPYAFNVADIAIFVGGVGLFLIPAEKKAG